MNGVYVVNNPFPCDALNKGVDMSVLSSLQIPHPKTFILPSFESEWDMGDLIGKTDWGIIEKEFSFPLIMKPLMGWGWQDVYIINSLEELKREYDAWKENKLLGCG